MTRPGQERRGRGAVIAFVGSEATGKSTMLAGTAQRLGERTDVRSVHAGKPPPTALTRVPNSLLPALRRLAPGQRSTRVDARRVEHGDDDGLDLPPLLFAVRAALLAHDRRTLLRGAHAASAAGAVVLCDRYPSSVTGAPDSPQLARWSSDVDGHPVLSRLVRAETRLYAQIPAPDVVFHLWAPLDVTLERNRQREKTEPEELVRLRHQQAGTLRFDGCPVHRLDTTRPARTSLDEVEDVVSRVLGRTVARPGDPGPVSTI